MLAAEALCGQTASGPPAFEVASIKPSPPSGMVGCLTYPGGRIVCRRATLEMLLEEALDVQAFQISGGPGWMRDDRFDVEAKPPASSKSSEANPRNAKAPPNEEQRQMLQTMLSDRFQLKFHRETRQGPFYLLVKGSKALKLETAKDHDKSDFSWVGSPKGGMITGDGMAGENISMPILATRLSKYLGRPVLDQTGIAGYFDFSFEYATDDPHPDVTSAVLASVQGIGLKLESGKGPVETILIDHAEKPSPN